MFKVMIETNTLIWHDDTITGEYTGNRYATYDEAKPELTEARRDSRIKFAWIEEVE